MSSDPQPGQLWSTSKGRTVEILARGEVANSFTEVVDVIAYRFLGGSMIHLRSVSWVEGWKKVEFE